MTDACDGEDLASIKEVYVREYQRVRSHLRFALRGNGALAEDLTHEVFLELWRRHGDSIAAMSHTHVRAKLIMTANCRVIDLYRKASREIPVADPTHETVPAVGRPVSAPDPSERVLTADVLDRFWRLLREDLTDKEFQAAFLSWGMGLTGAEVAAELGTTRTVAYQLREAARKKIDVLVNRNPYQITFRADGDLATSVASARPNTGGPTS